MKTIVVIGSSDSNSSVLEELTNPENEIVVVNTKKDTETIDLTSKVQLSSLKEALETFIFENGKFKKKWQNG